MLGHSSRMSEGKAVVAPTIAFLHDVPAGWRHLSPNQLGRLRSLAIARGWKIRDHESAESLVNDPPGALVLIDHGSGRISSSDFALANPTPTFALLERAHTVDVIAGLGRFLFHASTVERAHTQWPLFDLDSLFLRWLDQVSSPANRSRVFVSYVRSNAAQVDNLVRHIEHQGYLVWVDRNSLGVGTRWKDEIRSAIRAGLAMIACFSSAYAERDRTYMNEELTLAIDEIRSRPTARTWFLPVRLDECEIPDRNIGGGESLRDIQAIDLFPDATHGYRKILEALAHIRL
jgi:hypothetical protein